MSKLDEFFKYKVGDTLQIANKVSKGLVLAHVVERMTQECPGGIQLHYTCRTLHEDGVSTNCTRYNEIELKEYDPEVEVKKELDLQFENHKQLAKLKLRAEAAAKEEIEKEGDES